VNFFTSRELRPDDLAGAWVVGRGESDMGCGTAGVAGSRRRVVGNLRVRAGADQAKKFRPRSQAGYESMTVGDGTVKIARNRRKSIAARATCSEVIHRL